MSDFDAHRLLPGPGARRRPVPVLRVPPRAVPGAARAAPRRRDGHGLRRGDRGVPRHRDVLVVQLGHRTVPRVSRFRSSATTSASSSSEHRDELPMSDQLPTLDPPVHTAHRGLLMRLITPKRLKENEAFMWRLADRRSTSSSTAGECEFVSEFASPFAMLVIADLLGVPEADHETFRAALGPRPGRTIGSTDDDEMAHNPLEFLYERFTDVRRGSAARTARRRADRASRPRRSPTARRPRSSTSCASPRTCSRPARRRPCACSRPRSSSSASTRNCSSCCATSAIASRTSSRRRCASRARSRATSACHASRPRSAASTSPPARR